MVTPQLVIVADDLTGAADTGATFAEEGLTTAIPLTGDALPETDILVLTTESREGTESHARTAVQGAAQSIINVGQPRYWYKKIDSCLRGHPGAEIEALAQVIQPTYIVVAPALPAEGRTTIAGNVVVERQPLHMTSLGTGESSSSILDHLRQHTALEAELLPLADIRSEDSLIASIAAMSRPAVLIADAEFDDDLLAISRAVADLDRVLLVGSAGLAQQLIRVLPLSKQASPPESPLIRDAPVLAVAGSRHESAAAQVDYARANNLAVEVVQFGDSRLSDIELTDLSRRLHDHLMAGRDTVVTTAGTPISPLDGCEIATDLARIAAGSVIPDLVGGFVVTGGDVAAAVCRELEASLLWLRGEVRPAIPWSTLEGSPYGNLPVVSKAGSFGSDETLVECSHFLKQLSADSLPTG